ncbi:PAS domain S-box protein [Methanobacterium sp. ACI-7]|uniref:PAS domain S-box protein n=1 Tax=unclassified Methanobacterium TaxID=2627676 RepID=UPI0039C4AADE
MVNSRRHLETEEELKYQTDLLDKVSDAVISTDIHFNIKTWNQAAKLLYGWSEQEVKGKSVMELIKTDYLGHNNEEVLEKFNDSGFWEGKVIQYSKDSKKLYIHSSVTLLKDISGNPVGAVAVNRDITARKKSEEALKEIEERYHALFKNNHAVMLLIEPDSGNIVDANPAACSFYGYDENELKRMKITDLNILTNEQVHKEMQKARAEQRNHFIFKHRLANGKIRDVDVYSGSVNVNGKKLLYSIIHDITKQKKVEESLKKSESTLKRAQKMAKLGSWNWDIKNDIINFSDEYLEIVGISHNLKYNYDVFKQIVHPDDLNHANKAFIDALYSNKEYNIDYRVIRPDGDERIIHSEGEVTFDENNKPIRMFGVIQDITERKMIEQRISEALDFNQRIISASPIGIAVYDKSGQCIMANKAAAKIIGSTYKEFMNQNYNFLQSWKISGLYDAARNVMENGGEIRDDSHLITTFGKEVWFEYYFSRFLLNGKDHLLFIFNDIQERKQLEKELRQARDHLEEQVEERTLELEEAYESLKENEIRYSSIIENSEDAILLTAPDGRILTANSAAEEMFGYTAEEICNLGRSGILDIEDPRLPRMLEERASTGKTKGELTFIRSDGSKFPGDVSTSIFKDRNGNDRTSMIIRDVTERKEAEEKLRSNEKMLSEAQRIANLGNWDWNIVTNELCWSDEIYRIFGRHPQEFNATYDAFLNYVHPDDQNYVDNAVKKALEGKPYSINHKIVLRDGNERIVHENGEVTFDNEGTPIKMVGTVQDITEQVLAEQQTRKLASIVESSDDAIISKDLEGNITSWNKGAEKIYGYNSSEVIGKHISILMSPDEWKNVYILMEKVQRGITVSHYEGKRIRKDGSEFSASVTLSPIRDSNGKITGISVIARDISERKQAEEDLKRSETILEEATKLSKVGAYEWNIKKDEFIFSREWQRIHGIKENNLPSSKLLEIAYPEDVEKVNNALNTALEGKIPYNIEHRIINQLNGEIRYIHAIGTVLKDEEDNPVKMYGVADDITETKLAEIEREALIEDLTRSNDELRQFAFITSHDLQEPLRTLGSYAGLLKRRYEGQLDKDADEYIEYMVSGAIRMQDMIKGLLEYSRVGSRIQFKEFNIEESLNAALLDLRSLIDDNDAEVTTDQLPVVAADFDQITRVFQNLITNSIKFRKKDKPPKIHITAQEDKENEEYVFSVSDNSIGMEQEYTDKIFEIFKRLHPIGEYEGAGIGLSIVKRIIDHHGGRIWVKSSLGEGSNFCFTLPKP